jgi:anti-sigma B factor antagonist
MRAPLIPPFDVRLRSSDDTVGVMVSGEVDLCTAPRLAQVLDRVGRLDAQVVVVDLEEVDFMDCAGLQVLLRAASQLDSVDGRCLYVTRARSQVRKLFKLTGVDQLLHGSPPETVAVALAHAA